MATGGRRETRMGQHRQTVVLVVAANAFLRWVLTCSLRSQFPEAEILEAEDVRTGRCLALRHHPSLVLTNVSLTRGRGLRWIRWLRKEEPQAAVVGWAAFDLPEYEDATRKAGACFVGLDELMPVALAAIAGEALRTTGRATLGDRFGAETSRKSSLSREERPAGYGKPRERLTATPGAERRIARREGGCPCSGSSVSRPYEGGQS